jgi:TetR/AcrR family transcriptional regulator, cholesterol catabolism regulator
MSRRTEILKRTTEVFERQGVTNTSLEDIAKAVGIKREAIYYYFKGRHDILLEIIQPQSMALLAGLRDIRESDLSAGEKLREAIKNHLLSYNPSYLEMSVALRDDHFFGDDGTLGELRETWNEYGTLWHKLIEEGQATGEFRADLQPKLVSFAVLGMCNWLTRWFDPEGELTLDDIIETYFKLTFEGLHGNTTSAE